jgi:hypothetical protein
VSRLKSFSFGTKRAEGPYSALSGPPALDKDSQDKWDAMLEDGDGCRQGTDQTSSCSLGRPDCVKTYRARAVSDGLISGVLALQQDQ